MSKVFHRLGDTDFFQDWSNTSLLTVKDDWSGVEAIMGYRGDLLASPGRDPRLVTGENNVINVLVNQANPNTLATGGVSEFAIPNPVVALQGSGTAQAPNLVLYLDASGRQNLHFAVDLRDIDGSADNSIQQVTVQYRLGDAGVWTNLPGGYVADASTGGQNTQVTHLSLDLPIAANNQSQVEIRIMTTDAIGSDEWVGVDNISVTSEAMSMDHTPPLLSSSSPADNAFAVAPRANLTMSFNELIALGSGTITISDGAGDVRTIDVGDASQVSVTGQTLVINPAADLHTATTYHVSIDAGAVTDLAGNGYAGTGANPIDFATIAALTHTYEIQGAGHRSAYEGQLVNTQGVVTAIDTTGTKGFWIQDAQGDGNDATSDAVFVFSTSASAQVHVGDMVTLQGAVDEYSGTGANNLSITEVTNVTDLVIVSSGNVIAPTIIGTGGRLAPTEVVDSDHFAVFNPDHDGVDFYESLEGMLVTAKNVQVVDGTYNNATYVVTDNGANATGMNDGGGITRSAGDANPERIEVFSDIGVSGGVGSYEVGDHLGDVTGIMTYFGGNYELIPTAPLNAPTHVDVPRDVTSLHGDAAHLTAGAYNCANLDPNDPQWKFDALAHDIAGNLGAPAILGLEEIQDSNGTGTGVLNATVTAGKLIDAIVAAGGPRYSWVSVDPSVENGNGGEPNGNIRSVIFYDPTRVTYVEGSVHLLNDNTPANGDSFRNSRHPLTADFTFHGEQVSFVGIHNYSRLGSDELYGVDQPAFISGDDRRTDQTATVRDYVHQLEQANPDANVIVAGDFNGYHFEKSLTQLEDTGELVNLVWTLPANDRYSSSFEGNNEQIDQLLVSTNLAGNAQFDNVHLNSNQPYLISPSDHDAVLSRLLINHGPQALAEAAYGGSEDVVLSVDAAHGVLANDTDVNGDVLSAVVVSGAAHGSLQLHADGSFEYLGEANYNGADSFSYVASDGFGGISAVTVVQLALGAVNDAPVAAGDSAVVFEDAAVSINVLGNDSDVDHDALTIVLTDAHSALGATLVVDHGQVVYSADADSFDLMAAGQSVTDSFTYMADDGHGGSSGPVTVSVTVREAGDSQLLAGSNKSDVFVDAAGHDTTFSGGNGDDRVFGGDGADVLNGDNGVDMLDGGAGSDTLSGGNGDDLLFGGAGNDALFGDNGGDVLVGGAGADKLTGGLGPDTFVFGPGSGRDTVTDFRPNEDRILTGYNGAGTDADLGAWLKGAHANAGGFSFADVDTDGDGHADAVAIGGGNLGADSIVLEHWTVATLVGQGFLSTTQQVHGGWLA